MKTDRVTGTTPFLSNAFEALFIGNPLGLLRGIQHPNHCGHGNVKDEGLIASREHCDAIIS